MYLFDLSLEYRVLIGISAMVLLFAGFLISFITSQRKKLQYHKELQRLNERQQQSLQEQNALLEWRVQERTTELSQQKEALQQSLTDLKNTQMQLIQREKMASLGELTAGIAHEIQNPLNFVNNFADVSTELLSELKDEAQAGHTKDVLTIADDLTQNLRLIHHHGQRASGIVRSMLEHSRSGAGQKQPTNLNALADEYLRLAYLGLRRSGDPADANPLTCELVTDFDPGLPVLNLVAQDMARVLLNLYNNAFYAVQQRAKRVEDGYEPTIWVSTRQQAHPSGAGGALVCIRVRDNGPGIPAAIQDKIFQPFFTTKPTGSGTGLGLSLSYDIITKGHGGRLEVASTEGEGTEFIVTLPVD